MKPVVCACAQLKYTGKRHDVCVAVTISFVSLEMCSFIANIPYTNHMLVHTIFGTLQALEF